MSALREMMDEDLVASLYSACLQQTRERAAGLASVQTPEALRETAHSLRGSVAMLGARSLAALAGELEDCENPSEQAQRMSRQLLAGCDRLEAALRHHEVKL